MERSLLDLWVGVFVVAGIGALVVLALKVSNASTFEASESYKVFADFDNIGGLKVRAPVKSAGVLVGRVENIQLESDSYLARVTIRVDKRYQFPKDSSANILTAGLLGEQYVGLDAGGDPASLKEGDKFRHTQSAMVLEKVIGQFIFSKTSEAGAAKSPAGK
jgi:phospholipid/cholesterol/gamma-HCH transport system substrate-binding protein